MPIFKVRGAQEQIMAALVGPENSGSTKLLEATINGISALFSAIAVVVLLTQTRALQFMFQTWVPFIPAVRNAHSIALVHNFTDSFEQSCDVEQLPIAVYDINITRNNVSSTYTMMPMAYDVQNVFPALLLIWVLAVSSAFQSYRCKHMPLLAMYGTEAKKTLVLLAIHAALHVGVWVRILMYLDAPKLDLSVRLGFLFALTFTCIIIIIYPSPYRNTTADFGRWLEYTLTAPVQVVIIGLSVWVRDRSTLYALGAAQAAMMLCGVVVEDCLQIIYQSNPPPEDDEIQQHLMPAPSKEHRRRAIRMVLVTLIIAWVSYGLIWYVLIAQFQRQDNITGKCDGCHTYNLTCDSSTPFLLQMVHIVVNRQANFTNTNARLSNASFVSIQELDQVRTALNSSKVTTTLELADLFQQPGMPSLDSVVQSMRADLKCETCPLKSEQGVCEARQGLCQGQNEIPDAVLLILSTQCLLFGLFGVVQTVQLLLSGNVHGEQGAGEAWYTVALAYAVLSVTAKTTLEIGFLVMLTQMPQELDRA